MTDETIFCYRRLNVLFAGLLSVSVTVLMSQVPPRSTNSSETSDREEITAIVQNWEEAWNSHDMRRLGKLFHEDGVWILWTGEVWQGRAKIEQGLAAVHETVYRNSTQRERIEELTFVGEDAAVIRFYSTLTGDERSPDKVIRSRKILIVTKRNGKWGVGWGQNTRLSDAARE